MRTTPALLALTAAMALALTACSDPGADTGSSAGSDQSAAASGATGDVAAFDVSQIPVNEEIAAMVPDEVKERGVLRNGASTDYAPAEYRASDGQTPVGYEIDLNKALARVMGLDEGTTTHAVFETIIPALGTKFDVGMSSFTVTPEREEQVNMVAYLEVGSSYAVAAGNPKDFDPADPCGATIGVQTGTYQQDLATQMSQDCEAAGKEAIKVMPLDLQTEVSTKVIGGQYDATLADSPVIGYAVKLANGQLEQIGDVIESEPQGIAIAKADAKLSDAVLAAIKHLQSEGYLEKVLAPYGAEGFLIDNIELNPAL